VGPFSWTVTTELSLLPNINGGTRHSFGWLKADGPKGCPGNLHQLPVSTQLGANDKTDLWYQRSSSKNRKDLNRKYPSPSASDDTQPINGSGHGLGMVAHQGNYLQILHHQSMSKSTG